MASACFVVVVALGLCELLGDDESVPGKALCGGLAIPQNMHCQRDVEWAFTQGRFEPWAAEKYAGMMATSGVSHLEATKDDFQRLFFCESWPEYRCGTAPCTCSQPPCQICGLEP